MNNLTINNSPSFTSRNSCIRDAHWVCHKINSELPHCSSSRFIPAYKELITDKMLFTNPNFDKNTPMPNSLQTLLDVITMLTKRPLSKAQLKSPYIRKNFDLLNYSKDLIEKMAQARILAEHKYGLKTVASITYQLDKFKIGNCYEDAKMAELILSLNGIRNACTAILHTSSKKYIDHIVCLFNKDGTPFNGKINNSTIVIDNWASKADYAHNMGTYYKNMFNNYFDISQDDKIMFERFDNFKLSSRKIKKLKKKYPQFMFPEENKFMHEAKNKTSPVYNKGLLNKLLNLKHKLITVQRRELR
ncbi:hypothetical protein J6E39_08750 [bacterium]|nr:hypothetical protein [bacterium]